MVIFFTSKVVNPPVTIYMGKDKVENEDLIKYAWPEDIWFHVDKYSSAHVYLRLPPSIPSWEDIPKDLLEDCAQLVKANSIEGNKKDNLSIIYTPASNLKKTGDMAVGQVSFHNEKRVKRVHIAKRENAIVNRLNKTKVEKEVDHEAERVERIRKETAAKRAVAAAKKKEEEELAKQRAAEKAARDYSLIDVVDDEVEDEYAYGEDLGDGMSKKKAQTVAEMIDDFM